MKYFTTRLLALALAAVTLAVLLPTDNTHLVLDARTVEYWLLPAHKGDTATYFAGGLA